MTFSKDLRRAAQPQSHYLPCAEKGKFIYIIYIYIYIYIYIRRIFVDLEKALRQSTKGLDLVDVENSRTVRLP